MGLQIRQFSTNSILASQVSTKFIAPAFPPDLDERFSHIEKHVAIELFVFNIYD